MYFLFCLIIQKHHWSYFAFRQKLMVEGKIAPAVLLLMRQDGHSLLAFPKFNKAVSIFAS